MATRTSRVRKCHVDGLRQSRPGTRVMPESEGTDQSAGFRTYPAPRTVWIIGAWLASTFLRR
ncbi:hypothetical protein SRABI128_06106 [Microbacterium sp. Bi128]|nr:hypothetical protein SRABI128_06106 [Microbacterium sp. Bi128]